MILVSQDAVVAVEALWATLIDTALWARWGPSITAVRCRDRFIGPGSQGRVRTAVGLWLPFRVTAFEPGTYWRWWVAGLPATGHRVTALGPTTSRLTFEVPVLAAPYAVVCRVACRRIVRLVES